MCVPCGKCMFKCSKLVRIEDTSRSHSLWLILCIYGLSVLEKIECETQQTANGRELELKLWPVKHVRFLSLEVNRARISLVTCIPWHCKPMSHQYTQYISTCHFSMPLQLLIAIWTIHFPPAIAKLFCWLGVVSIFLWCDYAVRHLNKTSVFNWSSAFVPILLAAQVTNIKNCSNMQQKALG